MSSFSVFTNNILLIGSGRLARHLQHWSTLNKSDNHSIDLAHRATNQELLTWNRSQPVEILKQHLQTAQVVWLAISDKSIVPFYEEYLKNTSAKVVHFSGALFDARILGAHPLMSFPEELLENEIYGQVHFAVDESVQNLQSLLPGFRNPYFKITAENKALYHALCVTVGNFPQLLWSICLKEFNNLNVPERAVEIYLQQIVELFIQHKERSLTGPLVRKDAVTIEKNISALQVNKPLAEIYKIFAGVYKHEN